MNRPYLFDGNEGFGTLCRNVSDIAANTGDIARDIKGENLKYWRDIAERDNINRHTLSNVNITFRGGTHNTINNNMDLDEVVEYITEGLEEALETTAERTNDYV